MVTRVPTRVKALAERIGQLASWFEVNRPSCKTIAVFKADWLFLLQAPVGAIRLAGFNITREKGLTFRGFTLKPVDQSVQKSKS